jgi:hypothetical protein
MTAKKKTAVAKKTAARKKTNIEPTPLFDEVAYKKILASIDEQFAKLHALQTEILMERAKQRGEFEAANRARAAEDRRMLRSARNTLLALPTRISKRAKKSST